MATSTISSSPLLLAAPKCASRASSKLCFDPSPRLTTSGRPRLDLCTRKRRFGGDSLKSSRIWRVSAVAEEALPPEATVEKAQQIIPAAAEDSAASTVVSALLVVAFIGLSILTIGVIYLAVQDFLRKREREKFEKEDAEKKKKGGKKAKAKARTGPRGFGQKIEEDED
ncbi:hypothetical protein C4D60_Mb06t34190 [Musa balbisiana]|uniref:Uncharacterized protein n=1 Tax=Musa balbisiana TaxID=52838 RepID=A0A4V4H4D7_MUSBA|nr:hypothetical protein C4D60_Mb06t34190 [Musa balbisiana]